MTYAEAGERLNVSPHAVRARATRSGWRRQIGNDGRARVLVALEPRSPDEPPMSPRSSPARKAVDPALVTALESHIKTLQGEIDALRQQLRAETDRLAAAEARSEGLAADVAALDAQHIAVLKAEQAKTEKAIAAFASLADRLDALAAERAKPWWRRLAG